MQAWSSWNTFRENVSDELLLQTAASLKSSGLFGAGYRQLWIDDGWSTCATLQPDGMNCAQPAPRDAEGCITPDAGKFPRGLGPLAADLAAMGITLGIYTAVSARTCGGYMGSLGNEALDAKCFTAWGIRAIKLDTCNTDCPIHNGCIQNSTHRMQQALNATGHKVFIYIDSGNPTSPQMMYNPKQYHVSDKEALYKLAVVPEELVWVWARNTAHMTKSWFDIQDTWASTLTNSHNQVRCARVHDSLRITADCAPDQGPRGRCCLAPKNRLCCCACMCAFASLWQAMHVNMYQSCGFYSYPGMLTVGQGAQRLSQYRVQFFLWAILASPLILGNDIRNMTQDVVDLLTAPEVLAIDQDTDCTQGSLVSAIGATELWVRPLAGARFAAVMVNKDPVYAQNVTLYMNNHLSSGSFFPAVVNTAHVRDVWNRVDVGVVSDTFTRQVPPMDAQIFLLDVLS